MALVVCNECKKQVSSAAAVCPHCGAPRKKKSSGSGILIVTLLIVGVVMLGAIATSDGGGGSSSPAKSSKVVSVDLGVSSTAIQVKNTGSAEWKEAVIYINGAPPFTFKHTGTAPSVGQSTTIDLSEFVDREGNRFNPRTKAVTTIWVGGDGFDYQEHRVH